MTDDCVGPTLKECPVCGAIGLPERIAVHDCPVFRTRQASDAPRMILTTASEEQ